jgi:hypothetical protein
VAELYKRWDIDESRFGDFSMLLFLIVQCLDGCFTYLGVRTWGLGVEGNPIVSSAVSVAGLGLGLFIAKLFAAALGIMLHLRRVHGVVATLSAIYLAFAIVPWALMFLYSL